MDLETTTNATCQISPHAHVVRAVLSAFVGSAIGGLTGGYGVVIYSAYLTWSLGLYVIARGFVFLLHCCDEDWDDDDDDDEDEVGELGWIGWIGWIYSAIYSPISQILWLADNFHSASPELKVVQAFAIGTSTLAITANPKIRSSENRWRNFIGVAFNTITGISLLILGVLPWVLYGSAYVEATGHNRVVTILLSLLEIPITSIMEAVLLLFIWLGPDLHDLPTSLKFILNILAIGCFAAIIAAPAFIIMWKAPTSPGLGLKDYLQCEGLALWRKIVAIIP
ncbi:hypothetical protein DEU56DRAFT_95798 [Suillus clintonianus]|uniref:uncharacterized protein n=1 Tax=Suillus clintonianus TaxID=1904413 RepID=UPI001B866DA2|nr:uncharacterized protein DEU56DRAFT_95798 [Suillus clintonianus]KAG2121436.1 hypothetical protein DEU56DRAFT_95798 [Suillus clintonianus]